MNPFDKYQRALPPLLTEPARPILRPSRRLSISMREYRCPFSILDEFEDWFEWHRLVFADGESTGEAMALMIYDRWRHLDRIQECELPRRGYYERFARFIPNTPLFVNTNLSS